MIKIGVTKIMNFKKVILSFSILIIGCITNLSLQSAQSYQFNNGKSVFGRQTLHQPKNFNQYRPTMSNSSPTYTMPSSQYPSATYPIPQSSSYQNVSNDSAVDPRMMVNDYQNFSIMQAIDNNDVDAIRNAYDQNLENLDNLFLDNISLELISPIHYAAMKANDPRILKILLDNGTDVDEKSENGKTPLFYALKYNPNPEIAFFLLNNGANPNARDHFNHHVYSQLMNNTSNISKLNKARVTANMIRHGVDLTNISSAYFPKTAHVTPTQIHNKNPNTKTLNNVVTPPQALTSDDMCIVCLEPIADITVPTYKTECCKQFLCQNCAQNIQRTAEAKFNNPHPSDVTLQSLISCPACRTNPLSLKNFDKQTRTSSSNAITLPYNF